MKLPFAKIAALALGLTLSASQADAIIYTAAKSGNYTDPATWGVLHRLPILAPTACL